MKTKNSYTYDLEQIAEIYEGRVNALNLYRKSDNR